MQRFAGLGLAVEITELDVTLAHPETELALQAQVYGDVYAGCFLTAGCSGVTTWGISDRFTWIRSFFNVVGAPLLFDADYQAMPAYDAARAVLQEAADRRR